MGEQIPFRGKEVMDRRDIDLPALLAELTELHRRLATIDALHQPAWRLLQGRVCCTECGADWPCPTRDIAKEPQ